MAIGNRVRAAGQGIFAYFAHHPTAANLLMVIMLVSGIAAATQIRSQYFPDVVINTVTVSVSWDGAGPEDVDTGIVALLEPALQGVDGVESTVARAREGRADIELGFEPDWDMTRALADVETALAGVTLPEAAEDPTTRRGQWRDRVTDVTIHGPIAVETLGRYADELEARLYGEGISRTTVRGIASPVIRISVPEAQLIRHDITLREIADAIAAGAEARPAGEVEDGGTRLRAGTERREAASIGSLVLRSDADGAELRLEDIARVELEPADSGVAYFREGMPAVSIRVDRNDRGDAIGMQRQVEKVAAEMQPTLAAGVEINLVNTRAEGITDRLNLLMRNGVAGLLLVVVTLFLFLSAGTAFWVAVGIPVALAAAVAIMLVAGLTLNMMSLFGLILCLGLVVDNAIVVAEHADWRRKTLGEPPAVAAETAARTMAMPVSAALLTTVIAFFALTAIGGRFGSLIADIPFTVIVVLTASFVECFLILPNHLTVAPAGWRRLRAVADAPSRTVNRWLDRFRARVFQPFVVWIIRMRYPVIAAAILLLAQSAAMFIRGDVTWRFFASPEQGSITANLAMLPGTDRAETKAMVHELERAVAAVDAQFAAEHGLPPVVSAVAQVGGTSGRGLSGEEVKDPDQLGAIDITLIDPDRRTYSSQEFVQALEAEVVRSPQMETLSFRSWGQGPGGDSLEVSFFGPDVRRLKAAAEALKAALAPMAIVTGLEDTLSYDKTELVLELTPLGERLGFTTESVGAELFARLSGIEAAEFAAGTRTATVQVGLPPEEVSADFLSRTRLRAPSGAHVPLSEIVTVESRLGFSSLRRENGQRMVTVSGEVGEDDAAAAADLTRRLESSILPGIAESFGVDYAFGGLTEQERDFLGEAVYGFMLCLVGIYLVLAWSFESWTRPFVVIAIIPFGMIGTIWGHWHWGLAMNLFTVVGVIGMCGIIVNNAILLISTADEYGVRRATVPAVVAASGDRLRPILITTLTTVLGLGPLVFERSQQALFLKPTAITLVYGLGIGSVLVLILVPALLVVQRDITLLLRGWRRSLGVRRSSAPGFRSVALLASLAAFGWLAATLVPWLAGGGGPAAWLARALPDLGAAGALVAALVGGLALVLVLGLAAGVRGGARSRPRLPAE